MSFRSQKSEHNLQPSPGPGLEMTTIVEFHSENHHWITPNFSSFANSSSKKAYFGACKYCRAWCTGWAPSIRLKWNYILWDWPNLSPFMKQICCTMHKSSNRTGPSSNGTSPIYNCFMCSTKSSHLLSLAYYCSLLILTSLMENILDTFWVRLCCIDLCHLKLCAFNILLVVYHSNIAIFINNSNYKQ